LNPTLALQGWLGPHADEAVLEILGFKTLRLMERVESESRRLRGGGE
jgi:hypothetical protein